MEKRNIVVIGASAGGVDALKKLLAPLPAELDASLFIVWHMAPSIRGVLPQILRPVTTMPISQALDGEPIQSSHIYVAPPDQHLLLEAGVIRLTRGPKENRFRPAIDPLFRSAALSYGNRVLGVILSGGLDDGTAGLWTIKQWGGLALVQDPAEAEVSSMPESAMRQVAIDYVLPADQLGRELIKLVKKPAPPPREVDAQETASTGARPSGRQKTELEVQIAAQENNSAMDIFSFGTLSPYTCPECHGVLTMLNEGSLARFRCHTGHAYSIDTLLAAVTETVEDNLYSTLRSMDEAIILLNHLGDHSAEANQSKLAALYFQKAQEAQKRADLIRQVVADHQVLSQDLLWVQAQGLSTDKRSP
ncbi:chemotaxis protein CheB [Spirosoma litoris]